MTPLLLLTSLAVLGSAAPVEAPTSHLSVLSRPEVAGVVEQIAQRHVPSRHRATRQHYQYRGYRPYRLPPSEIAPPMERVPQPAPLKPRIGN
jgi:hypothetical protein